jgi:gamma-glutamylcyclotransferase (GGCT)/AIG2-like uncharacterized protein YtfP
MYQTLSRYATYLGEGRLRGELYDVGAYPGVIIPEGGTSFVWGEVFRQRTLTQFARIL